MAGPSSHGRSKTSATHKTASKGRAKSHTSAKSQTKTTSKTTSKTNRAASKGSKGSKGGESGPASDVKDLPALKVGDRVISKYEVVAMPRQDKQQRAKYGVLAWTSATYDFERQQQTVPTLYIFRTKAERDEYHEELYDDPMHYNLQAYTFSPPVQLVSLPARTHKQ